MLPDNPNQAAECEFCGEFWVHLRCMNEMDSINFAIEGIFYCPECQDESDESGLDEAEFIIAEELVRFGFDRNNT